MVPNKILKTNARNQLGNRIFGVTWVMVMVAYIICSAIASMPTLKITLDSDGFFIKGDISSYASTATVGLVGLVLAGPMLYGFYRICTNVVRGKKNVEIPELFVAFKENFFGAMVVHLATLLFTFLWGLLFVIPGIVKAYSYSMAQYILQDDPSKEWKQCIEESEKMMKGHRWQLFCLDLSFIGWLIVGFLCLGIGVFFVYPYIEVSRANFYMALKAMNEPRSDFDTNTQSDTSEDKEPVDPFN